MHSTLAARRVSAVILLLLAACTSGNPNADSDSARGAVGVSNDFPADGTAGVNGSTSDTLLVTVEETVRPIARDDSLPAVEFGSGPGTILVQWTVVSGPCILADAAATRAGDVLTIRVVRRGDPAALCAPGEVVYSYELRVDRVPAGRYAVALIDAPLGEADRPAGNATVDVPPGGA